MAYRKMLIVSLLLYGLFVAGCATMPDQQELDNLDYGAPLTIDYEAVIKDYFAKVLCDPSSAGYKFSTPRMLWFKQPPLLGGGLYAGYMVFVRVIAKDNTGRYEDLKEHGFLFKNNQLIKVLMPQEFGLMRSR